MALLILRYAESEEDSSSHACCEATGDWTSRRDEAVIEWYSDEDGNLSRLRIPDTQLKTCYSVLIELQLDYYLLHIRIMLLLFNPSTGAAQEPTKTSN